MRYLLTTWGLSVAIINTVHAFGGAYVGADLGLGYASTQHKYADLQGKGKATQTAYGAVYGAHAGYLYEIGTSKTIVGGELYGNLGSMNPSIKVGADNYPVQGDVKIKRSNSVGAALIVGKMLNIKTLLYGRVAYERATYQHEYKFRASNTVGQQAGKTLKKNIAFTAPIIGAGIAYKAARMIMVGGEYQFAGMYGKKKVLSVSNIQTETDPVEHRILLKVSFVFG
ncbi:MAG: hypothetical protein K0M45_04770 [Candidatus Paracaedibacteraceae bacterium]|nr:hypothetical protein [Candidatus Paracaedibacteraceae bacterium]